MRERASGRSRLLLLAGLVVAFTPSVVRAELAKATFAGGCSGACSRRSGRSRASCRRRCATPAAPPRNPTYEEVSAGGTGHTELRSRPAPEGALRRRPTVGLMDRP